MQPDTIALVDEDRTITYGELSDLVWRTAGHLSTLGVRRGDYVGLCLKDDWQHVVAMLAIGRLGATFVQVDWRARSIEKARIAKIFDLKLALVLPGTDIGAKCPSMSFDSEWHRDVSAATPPSNVSNDWCDSLAVLASSGTTGMPAFTVATHQQFYLRLACHCELMPSLRPHRYLSTFSFSFSAGRVACLLHLLHGNTVIIYPSVFTAAEFVEVASRHRVTVAHLAPSTLRELLILAETRQPLLPNLELLVGAGAPLFANEKIEVIDKLTRNFHEIYAATAIGPISVLRPSDTAQHADSVGRPFPLVDVEIVDEMHRPVPTGETGWLRCRGPALASPVPSNSAAGDFRGGWHYPGEIAALDTSGYIHLHGRTSEVIFRGAAKIFPTEIEAVLQAHESVAEVAVVARSSSTNEQELVAYVVTSAPVAPGQLLAHCRRHLTPYKVPREIHIVSELPRNLSGKLDKRALASPRSRSLGTKR